MDERDIAQERATVGHEAVRNFNRALASRNWEFKPEPDPPKTNYQLIREFHETYGCRLDEELSPALVDERRNLIQEEWDELNDELWYGGDLAQIAKEAADLLYVTYGLFASLGINADAVVRAVHESNMSKLGEDGKPIYREGDRKVLKGPNYKEPDIKSIIGDV
jgi:predicted HAD superfamily Cof-like phosphohydrolase